MSTFLTLDRHYAARSEDENDDENEYDWRKCAKRRTPNAERQTPNVTPSPNRVGSSAIHCPAGRVGLAQQFSRRFAL